MSWLILHLTEMQGLKDELYWKGLIALKRIGVGQRDSLESRKAGGIFILAVHFIANFDSWALHAALSNIALIQFIPC